MNEERQIPISDKSEALQSEESTGLSTPFLFSIALGTFGSVIGVLELAYNWRVDLQYIGLSAIIVLSLTVASGFIVFKKKQFRLIVFGISFLSLFPFLIWSQASLRGQIFRNFAAQLPLRALQTAIQNDPKTRPFACETISALEQGNEKLFYMSKRSSGLSQLCASEIAKAPGGVSLLLSQAKNEQEFCKQVDTLEATGVVLGKLLEKSKSSLVIQKCVSRNFDSFFKDDESVIALLEEYKEPYFLQLVVDARYSQSSERLKSDKIGEWFFTYGCSTQNADILSEVGLDRSCPTISVESGWPNICEHVEASVNMKTICSKTREFTVGMTVNEAKRIVHRALRRYAQAQIADSIIAYDDTPSAPYVGGGGGRGGKLPPNPVLAFARGDRMLNPQGAALLPASFLEMNGALQGQKLPSFTSEEWTALQTNVFEQLFSGKFNDSRVAGYLQSKGLGDILPDDMTLEEIFEAQGKTLPAGREKLMEKRYKALKARLKKDGSLKSKIPKTGKEK